jgi:hypothetical protein
MVLTVVSKAEGGYSIAACDACRARCPESRRPKARGDAARDAVEAAAKAVGWRDRLVPPEPNPRRRKSFMIVELLCPECQAKAEAG